MDKENIYKAALRYMIAGLEVIPNHPSKKYPYGFDDWQTREFSQEEIKDKIFNDGWGIGIRNIEGLDIDNNGNPSAEEILNVWKELINASFPGLVDKLLIEKTMHDGYHIAWRCDVIGSPKKLAQRLPTQDELKENLKERCKTLVETKGLGGQFMVAPSPGYSLLQGDWANLNKITTDERLIILNAASIFDRLPKEESSTKETYKDTRPGDLYNQDPSSKEEALQLLIENGWKVVFTRNNTTYLRRPGKEKGVSATYGNIAPGIFYNFSSSDIVFEERRAYSPFQVLALLKYQGDFTDAARDLTKKYNLRTEDRKTISLPQDDDLFAESSDKTIARINTGFNWFDFSTGGLYGDALYVVAGPQKCGKTTYLMNVANNLLRRGLKIGYLDTELGATRFRIRMGALWHGVEKAEIEKSPEKYLGLWKQAVKSKLLYRTSKSLTDDNQILSVEYLQAVVEEWKKEECSLIFIDNLTKMNTPTTAGDNKGWATLAKSLNFLIDFSRINNIPVVVVIHTQTKSEQIPPNKIKQIIESKEPSLIFKNSARFFPRPKADELFGGAVSKLISGGVVLIWRPFPDFADEFFRKQAMIILEEFREGASVTEIPCEFDMASVKVREINPHTNTYEPTDENSDLQQGQLELKNE